MFFAKVGSRWFRGLWALAGCSVLQQPSLYNAPKFAAKPLADKPLAGGHLQQNRTFAAKKRTLAEKPLAATICSEISHLQLNHCCKCPYTGFRSIFCADSFWGLVYQFNFRSWLETSTLHLEIYGATVIILSLKN